MQDIVINSRMWLGPTEPFDMSTSRLNCIGRKAAKILVFFMNATSSSNYERRMQALLEKIRARYVPIEWEA